MSDIADLPAPDRNPVDAALVASLIDAQFPRWSGLQIRPAPTQGWDNCTFRLGDDMLVRLPTAKEYALAVEKEHLWLPIFAAALPLQVPVPLASGTPSEAFPHNWSVYRWLSGEPASTAVVDDLTTFAIDLAEFLVSLQRIDPTGGPGPGVHNWFRGGPLSTFNRWTCESLETLDGHIRTDVAKEIWERALRAQWDGPPVWFHGDVAEGNILVQDGALTAVIDFGTCAVGDPACDLAIAWTLFSGKSREAFRDRMDVDQATWERGQGWALWYHLKNYAWAVRDGEDPPPHASSVLEQLFADFEWND